MPISNLFHKTRRSKDTIPEMKFCFPHFSRACICQNQRVTDVVIDSDKINTFSLIRFMSEHFQSWLSKNLLHLLLLLMQAMGKKHAKCPPYCSKRGHFCLTH